MSHTPGPWEITGRRANHPDYPYYAAISAPGWMEFARVVVRLGEDGEPPDEEDNAQGLANAALIAAAPELLAACKAALAAYHKDERMDAEALLEAAIAKAETPARSGE